MDYVESKRANIKRGLAPRTGLIAEYLLDGDATDTSDNGDDGTVYGAIATKDRFFRTGKAMSFDGVNDYINLTAHNILQNGFTECAITGWINCSAMTTNMMIFARGDLGPQHALYITSSQAIIFRLTTTSSVSITGGSLEVNKWYFVAGVYDGSVMRIYINGENVGSATQTGTLNDGGDNNEYIGVRGTTNYFNGKISDLRIYDEALTESEIKNLYYEIAPTGETLLESGLVAHYKLDGNALDAGNNGMDGTSNGAVATTNRFGQSSKAMSFDGNNDYISIADDADLSFTSGGTDLPFSISCFIKADTFGSGKGGIISKAYALASLEYILLLSDSGNPILILYSTSTGNDQRKSVAVDALTTGIWYHIVATYDATTPPHIYVNGKYIAQTRSSSGGYTNMIDTTADLEIGVSRRSGGSTRYFDGKIDNLRIYDKALSYEEINVLLKEAKV